MEINAQNLQDLALRIAPTAPAGVGDALVAQGTPLGGVRLRWINLLANVAYECRFQPMDEALNYRAERLMEVWPKRFPTLEVAKPYERNPRALANKVYANRMGNGDEASGDGYRFRGRGWPQLTGRTAYSAVSAYAGVDLTANPDDLMTLDGSAAAAVGFWQWRSLSPLADLDNTDAVRQAWNGGTIGLEEVRKLVAVLKEEWPE